MSSAENRAPAGDSVVTIDGPAASGKSTVSRLVAARLGIPFVSSGLLYRAATYLALASGVGADDPERLLVELAERRVTLVPQVEGNLIRVDGRDVTHRLQTDEVDDAVSTVASHLPIREWVNARLREIEPPFVVEGRDMGSVVFPGARHKFYLTAPAEIRARRRLGERSADLSAVAASLRRRDDLDADRMGRAGDAHTIETGELTPEQVVERVLDAVNAART